jgi:hypothetical protein
MLLFLIYRDAMSQKFWFIVAYSAFFSCAWDKITKLDELHLHASDYSQTF